MKQGRAGERGERRTGLEKNEGIDRRQGRAGEGEKGELVQRRRMREKIGCREEQGKGRKKNWFREE
jgi:hypothetical protein